MKMTTAKAALKGKVLAPRNGQDNLAEQAKQLDRQIRAAVKAAHRSLIDLGRLLAQMRELALWEHLPGHYRGWEHYAQTVMGPRARSSLHEIVAAYSLTQGPHAIPAEVVNRMGIKRAAQLARLKPEQRRSAIIHAATSRPVTAVRQLVQETLNLDLPPDEQQEAVVLFARNFRPSVIARYEALEERAVWMEGVRDGDRTLTQREKFFLALISNFEANFDEELRDADQWRAAHEASRDQETKAAQAYSAQANEDAEDFPPEPEELDAAASFFEPS
jgi:hypothetical protein